DGLDGCAEAPLVLRRIAIAAVSATACHTEPADCSMPVRHLRSGCRWYGPRRSTSFTCEARTSQFCTRSGRASHVFLKAAPPTGDVRVPRQPTHRVLSRRRKDRTYAPMPCHLARLH